MPPRGEIPNDGKNRSREAHARHNRDSSRRVDVGRFASRECAHAPRESERHVHTQRNEEGGYPAKETRLTIRTPLSPQGVPGCCEKTDENKYQHVWIEDRTQIPCNARRMSSFLQIRRR